MASVSWQPVAQRERVFPIAWLRAGIVATTAALVGVALLLASRRFLGALTAPLPLASSLPTVVIAAMLVWSARGLWRRLPHGNSNELRSSETILAWGGSFALIALSAACSLPNPQVFDLALWLPAIVLDQFHRQAFLAPRPSEIAPQLSPNRGRTIEYVESLPPSGKTNITELLVAEDVDADDSLVVQQLRRVRDEAGTESIHGTLRAEFAVGQRHAILHAGFCPPLARLPIVEAETSDGPDAVVRVVQAFAHGVRLEVRLAEPTDEPCAVTVEISATPRGETLAV